MDGVTSVILACLRYLHLRVPTALPSAPGFHHSFAGGERRISFEVCLPKPYAEAGRPSLSKGYLLFSGVPDNAERAAPGEE